MKNNSIIIIPIRMASTRLPGKFHSLIENKPMIIHVLERALETGIPNVIVAGDHADHQKIIEDFGQKFIMTGTHHQSGSDRIYEALCKLERERGQKFDYVINLQGDAPFVSCESILSSLYLLKDEKVDIGTIAAPITDPEEVLDPNVVKVAVSEKGRALYFSRASIPHNASTYYHHIGVYAYKRHAIEKYINLEQSQLEKCEKLEQLRALENDMQINLSIVNEVPITVDVEEDLTKARLYAKKMSSIQL